MYVSIKRMMPLVTAGLGLAASALTQTELPKQYECRRAPSPLRIDGRLDKPEWQRAPWSDWFVDIQGDRLPKPRFKTRVKLLWDDDYLYVGAELEEPDVWATLLLHDSVIYHDNDFEVFLNPTNDGKKYFEFEINALNTGWDLFLPKPYNQDGRADNSWEIPGLKTAVWVDGTLNHPGDTDRGWTVEIAFPWSAFADRSGKGRPVAGESWRINFSRVEWKVKVAGGKYEKLPGPEDNWVWSPQGVINMHVPEKWGTVRFVGTK
jgi:Carbohydrate family 9 binding domain-like